MILCDLLNARDARAAALDLVVSVAERWGENREECAFSDRVDPKWTDEQCVAFADKEGAPVIADEVIEIRDLWRATQLLRRREDPNPEPPQPVDDGSCDPLYGQRMDSADMGEN